MSVRCFRLSQSVENGAICLEAAEGDAAAFAGGELSVRKSGAGAAAAGNVISLTGNNGSPTIAVICGIFQKIGCSGKRRAVMILFLHLQRSRSAEVILLLCDSNAVLGD